VHQGALCACSPFVKRVETATTNTPTNREHVTIAEYAQFKVRVWSVAISGIVVLSAIRPLLALGIAGTPARSEDAQERMYRSAAYCHSSLTKIVDGTTKARKATILYALLARTAKSIQLRIEDFIEDRVVANEIQERIDELSGLGQSGHLTNTS